MDYKEAADRIEEHMIVHHMAEYPHAVRITEALGIAIKLLRETAGVKEPQSVGESRITEWWSEWEKCWRT